MLPLFGAVPGGPELLVILLVVFLLFGPVVLAVVLAMRYFDQSAEVEELQARIDELESDLGDGDGQPAERADGARDDER